MSQLPITAVIFDMDGVLTDSEPLINAAAVAMFKEKGLAAVKPEDFVPFVGTGEDRYIGGVAELHNFPLNLPEAKRRTYEIYLALVPERLKSFPGATALVQACRSARLKVAVASSADRIKVAANLNQIGLPPENWDAVITAEDATAKKPAPDLFLAAAARMGVSPAECVVVEDAVNGVQAAKAAGMRCVAVCQTFPATVLQAADLTRATIAEITLADLTAQGSQSGTALPPVIELPPFQVTPPPPRKEGWGAWATLGLGLVAGGVFILGQAIGAAFASGLATALGHGLARGSLGSNGLIISFATLFAAPAVVGCCLLFAIIRCTSASGYLAFAWPRFKPMVGWTLGLVVLIAGSDFLTLSLGRPLVPEFMERIYATAGFQPLLWMALVVAAPLSEETLFRGFLFAGLVRSPLGAAGTIVVTSLLWAAIHLQYDAYGIASIFVSGLYLGWVRLKTGSTYATMFLHGVMNLVATIETACLFHFSITGN